MYVLHHSEKLKTSSGMEEYERAGCNRGYYEYKVLTASYHRLIYYVTRIGNVIT